MDALEKVAKQIDGSLVLMGHSMGGVILYDVLSDPKAMADLEQRLGAPLAVDLFVTVGSQVALFEELKLFQASDDRYGEKGKPPFDRVPKPSTVKTWWNVYNRMDVLSFLTKPVFTGVEDFAVDTMAGVQTAHSAYFTNMLFYERLASRIGDAGLK